MPQRSSLWEDNEILHVPRVLNNYDWKSSQHNETQVSLPRIHPGMYRIETCASKLGKKTTFRS